MTEATLWKSLQDDKEEILRLRELSRRQALSLVEALGKIGDL